MSFRLAVPSAVTLSGLFFALWAMVEVAEGDYVRGAWLIWIAALIDVADGGIARALNAISPFGKDLDSLVDFASAGIAPAFLLHQVFFDQWGWVGLFPPMIWASFVAARLARFNTAPVTYQHFFEGVPCPPGATIVVHYYLFSTVTFDNAGSPYVSLALILTVGPMMLSSVPYEKARWLAPRRILRNRYGLGTLAMVIAIPFFPRQSIFVVTSTSVVAAAARHVSSGARSLFVPAPSAEPADPRAVGTL